MTGRAVCFVLAAMSAWWLGGCGGESAAHTELIGSAGGIVEHEGVALEIPAGALDEEVEISISTSGSAPDGYAMHSPVYVFEPDGLQFAIAAEVTITFDGDVTPSIQWSIRDGDGFEAIATQRSGMLARGAVTHFSRGFVGDATAAGPDAGRDTPDAGPHDGGSCQQSEVPCDGIDNDCDPATADQACASGHTCVAGQCASCGHVEEMCCPGNVCVQGSCVVFPDASPSGICLFAT